MQIQLLFGRIGGTCITWQVSSTALVPGEVALGPSWSILRLPFDFEPGFPLQSKPGLPGNGAHMSLVPAGETLLDPTLQRKNLSLPIPIILSLCSFYDKP